MELSNDFRVDLPVEQAWAVLTDVERIAPCLPGAQLQEIEGDEYRGVVKVKVGPMTAQYKGKATFVERDDDGHVAVLRAEGKESRGQGTANATITARLTPEGDGTAVSVLTDLTITGRVAQFGRGVLADVSAKLLEQFADNLAGTIAGSTDETAPAPAEATGASGAPASPVAEAAPVSAPAAATQPGPTPAEPEAAPAPAATPPAPAPAEAESEARPAAASGNGHERAGSAAPAATSVSTQAPPAVRKIESPEPQPIDLVGTAGAPIAQRVAPILVLLALIWLLRRLFGHSKD